MAIYEKYIYIKYIGISKVMVIYEIYRYIKSYGHKCIKAGGAGPTTPTLVGPKISPLLVKFLHLESFGWTNNCQVKVLLRWSDQSYPPSATPVYDAENVDFKFSH